MSYLTSTPGPHGRTEHTFDMAGFGQALATALGASFAPETRDTKDTIALPDGLELHLYWTSYQRPTTVKVSGWHPRRRELDTYDVPVAAQMPRVSVSFDRDIEALARDVTRRVIEPSKEAAVALLKAVEERQARVQELDRLIADLGVRFPLLQATKGDRRARDASLYLNTGDRMELPFFSGRITSGGHVTVDRVGSMSHRRFLRVMQALTEPLDG